MLNDIGSVARQCGDVDTAYDAFTRVRERATQVDVIWSAGINLLALAADNGTWEECDRLRHELRRVPRTKRLRCEFDETVAYSLAKRGARTQAETAYRAVAKAAAWSGFTEISTRAARAASGGRT